MISAMRTKDERKAPLPRQGLGAGAAANGVNRGSSQNLEVNRETRKDFRTNLGQQVIAGVRGSSAKRGGKVANPNLA